MKTCILNGIEFQVKELDGEVFYAATQGQLHHQTMKKIHRDFFNESSVRVYDTKNGVISIDDEDAVFWANIRTAKTNEEKIDLLFA